MELNETVALMNSDDFKDRFVAEYAQLVIRKNGLATMLEKLENGTLPFKPKCSPNLLRAQLDSMMQYAKQLEARAEIEGIELPNI